MAVYSIISELELKKFLLNYDIGDLLKLEGILEGIENTNYKITTTKNIYILTIFEKRVKSNDLPFFINLKKHLIQKNFLCPKPIANKKGIEISSLNNKSCLLTSYLEGSKNQIITPSHCQQVGEVLSSLHINTKDFQGERTNRMNYTEWHNIFTKCKTARSDKHANLFIIIENELFFLKENWPTNLPFGIIHADVFQDNVFFINNTFSGLIDFYFACNDFLSYDIALTINAWCFNAEGLFNIEKFKSLIKGYEATRTLSNEEKNLFSILLRGAAIRILLTRLHDQLFHQKGSFVQPKNPDEYEKILKYHQINNIISYLP